MALKLLLLSLGKPNNPPTSLAYIFYMLHNYYQEWLPSIWLIANLQENLVKLWTTVCWVLVPNNESTSHNRGITFKDAQDVPTNLYMPWTDLNDTIIMINLLTLLLDMECTLVKTES